ncbi:MAG: Na/Pi cotransporter family protein [Clostridiales bacterium]|nr:Na/Pi cotransporter family protein [Clostridiales bacterium]
MKMMGEGLELVAGSKLRGLLEKLTSNPLLGVLVGVVVTGAIQSSSATTVMVVGFLNAGLLKLEQAVYVIMGANIGTTVTSFLIGLKINYLAPIAVFLGVIMVMMFKKKIVQQTGMVIIGFGILFTGMDAMSSAMAPLKDIPEFAQLMVQFSNPVLGILAGAILTAVIQSSSASVGIVQAMAASGVVGLGGVVYILFGQNIGTCATALLASIGTNRAGKRAAVIHLLFNVIGTLIFIPITMFLPYVPFIESLTSDPKMQISVAHIIFNIVVTLVMLPFAQILVKLAAKLVPGQESEYEEMRLHYLDERILQTPPIAVAQVIKEVERMAGIASRNFKLSIQVFFKPDKEKRQQIRQNEQVLNFLNHSITSYLVKIHALDLMEADNRLIGSLFHVVNDLERVGDHAENILEYSEQFDRGLPFSPSAMEELKDMSGRVQLIIDKSIAFFMERKPDRAAADVIIAGEEEIDELVLTLRAHHVTRLNALECSPEMGMTFVDILTDLERVSDHATNIMYAAFDDDCA